MGDVKIDAKLTGAEAVVQGLKEIGSTATQSGQQVNNAGKDLDDIGQASKNATMNIEGMVAAFGKIQIALQGVMALYQEFVGRINEANAAMSETMKISSGFTNDISGVQHMLGKFDPSVRKDIGNYAIEGERSLSETAGAYYNLISSQGSMTESQRDNLFKEALELGLTEPGARLDQIVSAMALYSQKTGNYDANSVQNLLKTTLKNAKADMSGVASYMPKFLPNALAAGLSGPDALGVWSTASLALNSPDQATTSLEGFFQGLEGKGTPESQKLLSGYGITENDDFFTKVNKLSQAKARGELGYSEMTTIAGGPGAAVMGALLDNPELLAQNVMQMRAVNSAERLDIVKKEVHQKMMKDPFAKAESMRKKAEIEEEWYRANDLDAAQLDASEAIYRAAAAKRGEAPSEAQRLIDHNRVMRRFGAVGDFLDPLDLYHIPEVGIPGAEKTIINNHYGNVYNAPNPTPRPVVGPDDAQ